MLETREVKLTEIKYIDRIKYFSVCGKTQLQNFFDSGSMNCYDAESAPTEYLVKITTDFDDPDQIINEAQRVAEEELGLEIKTFMVLY